MRFGCSKEPDVPLVSEVCVHHRSLYSLLATENQVNPAFLTSGSLVPQLNMLNGDK